MKKSIISMKTVCEDKKSFENESLDLFQIDQNSSLSLEDPKLKTKPTLWHFSLIVDAKNRPKSWQNGLKNGPQTRQLAVRKLSALAVWFGFQGNRQFGILSGFRAIGTWEFDLDFRAIFNWEVYLDFKQLATGNNFDFRLKAIGSWEFHLDVG